MEIFDKKNNLIAIIHFATDFKDGKNFYTKEDADFQFGSFSLKFVKAANLPDLLKPNQVPPASSSFPAKIWFFVHQCNLLVGLS